MVAQRRGGRQALDVCSVSGSIELSGAVLQLICIELICRSRKVAVVGPRVARSEGIGSSQRRYEIVSAKFGEQ